MKEGYVSYSDTVDTFFDEDCNEFEGTPYILIDKVYVYPEYRKQGFARKLLAEALAEVKDCGKEIKLVALPLEESIGQDDLVAFYESMGFRPDDEPGCSGVIMSYWG